MESTNELTTHLISGGVIVYGIETLKSLPWCRWLTTDTKTLNRMISGLAAFIMAVGITWTTETGGGWAIHIPAGATLLAGLWEWVKQMTLQQMIYDGVVQK